MMRWELARGRRLALISVVAGTCITLTACGASSADRPAKTPPTSKAISASTEKFCKKVSAAMASLAGQAPGTNMTLPEARKTLDRLLDNGIKSFSALVPEAPASLRKSVKVIVADFKSYKALTARAETVKELLDTTVTASPAQKRAYQQLLGYSGTSC
jgi:hypothetical protein